MKTKKKKFTKPLRNLGFPISASKTFTLASFDVLGQQVTIKYVISITSSKAINKIVITSGLGTLEFGNTGCSGSISKSYSYSTTIFKFILPPPFSAISVGAYVKGSLYWGLGVQSGSGTGTKYWAELSGKLALGAEIKAGWDAVASATAYAEGNVIDASGRVTISNGSVAKGSGLSLSVGKLVVGVKGCLVGVIKKTFWEQTLYNGYRLY